MQLAARRHAARSLLLGGRSLRPAACCLLLGGTHAAMRRFDSVTAVTRGVLLRDDRHNEGGVDGRATIHHDAALVAAIPDHDGRVCGEATDHVAQLRLLRLRWRRGVAVLPWTV